MYNVYLDGVKIDHCHTADEELGVCYCWVSDEGGIVVNEYNKFDSIELHGEVRLERIGHARIY